MVNSASALQVLPLVVLLGNIHLCVSMFFCSFSCHGPATGTLSEDLLFGTSEMFE